MTVVRGSDNKLSRAWVTKLINITGGNPEGVGDVGDEVYHR